MTVVLSEDKLAANPYHSIKELGCNWVSLVPFINSGGDLFELDSNKYKNWWGMGREGLLQNVKWAREAGLKVMIKPQVFVENAWPGVINFDNEDQWLSWERQYSRYLETVLTKELLNEIQLLCIGTELVQHVNKRPAYWKKLVQKYRSLCDAPIVYCANWDNYRNIEFWSDLDYICLSSYFPLDTEGASDVTTLEKAWQKHYNTLRRFAIHRGKAVIFGEFGYLSVADCEKGHWNLEPHIKDIELDYKAQETAFKALFRVFTNAAFWKGGFVWKWYPPGYTPELGDKDYEVQNKPAIEIIKIWYKA